MRSSSSWCPDARSRARPGAPVGCPGRPPVPPSVGPTAKRPGVGTRHADGRGRGGEARGGDDNPSIGRGIPMDVATLAELLHETAEHHDSFEKATPPHNWWEWYAPYLSAREDGKTSEQAVEAADRYMREVRGVVRGTVAASAE